jgi:hypothetical protein
MRRLLSISVPGVVMLIAAVVVTAGLLSTPELAGSTPEVDRGFIVIFFAGMGLYWGLGAVIVMRADGHVVGWLFAVAAAYAVLTSILAALDVAGFLGLPAILAPFTASARAVVVAASTLAVFALFSPVRRRIQAAVDRRFYPSRYDAAREIDGFAARIRDEVEIDRLAVDLAKALERTMQPASGSIWLRALRKEM